MAFGIFLPYLCIVANRVFLSEAVKISIAMDSSAITTVPLLELWSHSSKGCSSDYITSVFPKGDVRKIGKVLYARISGTNPQKWFWCYNETSEVTLVDPEDMGKLAIPEPGNVENK